MPTTALVASIVTSLSPTPTPEPQPTDLPRVIEVSGPCTAATLHIVKPPPPPPDESQPAFYNFAMSVPADSRSGLLWLVASSIELTGDWAGDHPVELCVVSVMVDCPVGDERGTGYQMKRADTGEVLDLFDALHICGGA